jgi:hypothetical protein
MERNEISCGSKEMGGVVSTGFVRQASSSGSLRKAPWLRAASSSSQASRKAPLQAEKQHVSQQQLQAQHLPAVSILQSKSIELQKQV